jgi:hypothetical protein
MTHVVESSIDHRQHVVEGADCKRSGGHRGREEDCLEETSGDSRLETGKYNRVYVRVFDEFV